MENGVGIDGGRNLVQQLSALSVSNDSKTITNTYSNNIGYNSTKTDGLFQVMKAVEAAEATIKQQVEENNRLRYELQKKIQELEKYNSDGMRASSVHTVEHWDNRVRAFQSKHRAASPFGDQTDGFRSINNSVMYDPSGILLQKELMQDAVDSMMQTHKERFVESCKMNGNLPMLPDGQIATDREGLCQFSSPSTASFSPSRYQLEGEYETQFNLSGHGLMPVAEVDVPSSTLKTDVDTQEHAQEILQLRKHLADYSIKEAQIRNEKYALEKRIAYMRMAFDQQQQDLVDAASKALSYRQDIIEENIRLTYALQDAQEERSTFVSSLMPLLAEYSLQPPVADAQSIVSNLKVLFRHLQERLIVIEGKLKESHYQLSVWHSDVNPSTFAQSPSYSFGNKNGLELVPQRAYSDGQLPSFPDRLTTRDWDIPGHQSDLRGDVGENLEPDAIGRYSPLASRKAKSLGIPAQLAVDSVNPQSANESEETSNKQVTFSDPVSSSDMDDIDVEGRHNEGEPFVNWGSKSSPYTSTLDDPSFSYSPYLPPVLEEPSSSFSEAADDDPSPAVESLQISGEAFPGRELQASGYSLNGTTSCNFEWVRHMEDGSVNYIDGAKQPNYLVTADDVDTYLAIEVQPMDKRKRKGELVKVFANEHRKIICDPEMHDHITKTLYTGHASYRLSLSTGFLDFWEPATLTIKREGYSIKGSGVVVTEKFSPSTIVTVPCGNPVEFSVIGSGGEQRLQAEYGSTDVSCSRDTIVLTMRFFIKRASEKKKGKKRGLFVYSFNK